MAVDESGLNYTHPLYDTMMSVPGLSVFTTRVDQLMTWGLTNALWIFPMATSCCGIELMATAASRVDIDRMGTIVRGTPRQADVMVVAGTITVKMAPRVKKLWDLMPEPKWCIAMGSCAISGDFYRDLYPTIPGIDTVIPVDVYVPGCPPNPEALMEGMLRLQEKIRMQRDGRWAPREARPETAKMIRPSVGRFTDRDRDPAVTAAQLERSQTLVESSAMIEAPTESRERAPSTDARGDVAGEVELEAALREHFGVTEFPKDAAPMLAANRTRELATWLQQRGYRQLVYIVASHWPARTDKAEVVTDTEHYEVAYAVRTLGRASKLAAWRVRVEAGESVASLFGIHAGADWQEREQYDLVGVRFDGHPDLRRIMLPHDYQGHPLRRDFASDAPCAPWR